ncbi:MAG: hypothetical protein JRF38_08200 [Deltaproteobacteria bacterium]|jgi:hypothetical protein|nr:hypothetical protein [Deltaproteobacteria bacterium]
MGTDTNTETSNPEIQPRAQFDPTKAQAAELDERDALEPLKSSLAETDDDQQENGSVAPDDEDAADQEIPLDEMNARADSDGADAREEQGDETEIHLDQTDQKTDALSEPDDPQGLDSDEKPAAVEPTPSDADSDEGDGSGKGTAVPAGETPPAENPREPGSETGEIPMEAIARKADKEQGNGPERETTSSDDEAPSARASAKVPLEDGNENDWVDLDDDEVDARADVESQPSVKADDGEQKQETIGKDRADKKAAKGVKQTEALPKPTVPNPKAKKPPKDATAAKKIVLSTLILLMVAGAVIYSRPALFGLKGASEQVEPGQAKIEAPAKQPQIQAPQQQPHGENDRYRSKLEEASRLRDELLAKREEIYRLKLHYRNGIAELKDQIYLEIQTAPVSSYEEALQNKRIELNLRTIQRRQIYIQELEKPDRWAHQGSEELLFLKRKTLIDLDMADIAGGVDLARHMRYLNAAIQKYQPSADKLAVDPPPAKQIPLETTWRQIRDQQSEYIQAPVGEQNEHIISEICSGEFTRIAQLTTITPQAAECLARMDGSELFLNGLTQLNAKEAEFLFKWKGNWICLNGVKKLSPAVAKYLFKWEGNWISLNGLTELPPELALYLTEWRGNQLELMGLGHEKSKPDDKALKYLALWETMGGKLFISDEVRKAMKRVM